MSSLLFYIVLVAVSPSIDWHWGWFLVSLIFAAVAAEKEDTY